MKKLMIVAAVVLSAVAGNAVTAAWGTGSCYYNGDGSTLSDSTKGELASGTAYLFLIETAGTATAPADYTTLNTSEKIWNAFNKKDTLTVGENKYNVVSTKDLVNGKATFDDPTSYTAKDYAYAIIVVTEEDAEGVVAYSANGYWKKVATTGIQATKAALNWDSTTGAATTWTATAVPEPFSGALCLLGMGAIALRRKMKKAKKA